MNREEKRIQQYGLMFRDYPDAVTPEQVQEMLGIGRRKAYDCCVAGSCTACEWGECTVCQSCR